MKSIRDIESIIITNSMNDFVNLIDAFNQDDINQTLIMTVNLANIEMTKLLINKYNANPNWIDLNHKDMKFTSLIRTESIEIMEILLDAGANPNHQSKTGRNVIMYDASYIETTFQRIVSLLQLFLHYDIDLSLKDNDGYDVFTLYDKTHKSEKNGLVLNWLKKNYQSEYNKYMKKIQIKKFKI